jgi:hypothetical protein
VLPNGREACVDVLRSLLAELRKQIPEGVAYRVVLEKMADEKMVLLADKGEDVLVHFFCLLLLE